MTNYFEKYAQTLYDNGYSVIPLMPNEKYPLINGWQTAYRNITQSQLDKWLKDYPSHGVGVQTFDTPAIDIDIRDAMVAEKIHQELTSLLGDGAILRRVGQAPKFLIPCQTNEPFSKISGQKFFDESDIKHQIEIHCNGQQFVTFGYHKGAKVDYEWVSEKSLLEVKRTDLPMIGHALVIEIKGKVEQIITDNTNWGIKGAGGKIISLRNSQSPVVSIENIKPPVNKSTEELKAALEMINADDRDIWIKVGMALHHQYQGNDEGFYLWDEWSQPSHKYNIHEMPSKWKSFKRDNAGKTVTAASILALTNSQNSDEKPKPLTESTHKVMPFDADKMLPSKLARFVKTISESMLCPPDFIGAGMIPMLCSLIGSKAAIQPKPDDTSWKIYPVAWGMLIAEPSQLKTPALQKILDPIEEIQKQLDGKYQDNKHTHECAVLFFEAEEKEAKSKIQKAVKSGKEDEAMEKITTLSEQKPTAPLERNLIANDATVEKLQVMMYDNQSVNANAGMLFFRDELSSLLDSLDREEKVNDRGFMVQCYNGYGRYSVHRMTRDKVIIEYPNACVLGGIQPSRLMRQVKKAIEGTANDGLLQRFQFAVMPQPVKRHWVESSVDESVLGEFINTVDRLHELRLMDEEGNPSLFKFDEKAQEIYIKLYNKITQEEANECNPPIIRAHLGKMNKTIATLSLVFELVESQGNHNCTISEQSMLLAANWFEYLMSHAEAIYSVACQPDMDGAKLILARKEKLPEFFTAREIVRKRWAGLSKKDSVETALEELEDMGYVVSFIVYSGRGGQTTKYKFKIIDAKSC
jgi:hypothetical protein